MKEADAAKDRQRKKTQPQDSVGSKISIFFSAINKPPANMPVLTKVGSKWCCARTTERASLQDATIRCN